jgi:hypothetical protein
MTLPVRRDLELGLGLSPSNLARGSLFACLFLFLLRHNEQLTRGGDSHFALGDLACDLARTRGKRFQSRDCCSFALGQSFDESAGFCRLTRGALMLPREGIGAIRSLSV